MNLQRSAPGKTFYGVGLYVALIGHLASADEFNILDKNTNDRFLLFFLIRETAYFQLELGFSCIFLEDNFLVNLRPKTKDDPINIMNLQETFSMDNILRSKLQLNHQLI